MGEIQYLFCLNKIPVLFNQMIRTVFSPLFMFPMVVAPIDFMNQIQRNMLFFAQFHVVVLIIATKMFPVEFSMENKNWRI